MELLPDIDKDNLVATVYDSENNLLASGRIAGVLQEGEVRLETDGNGKFTFKNLELIEGVQELQIYLYQILFFCVFLSVFNNLLSYI